MKQGIERTWNFERWAHEAADFTLFMGIVSKPQLLKEMAKTGKIVHINTEEPNGFFSRFLTSYEFEDSLSKVFTYCPFTAEWYNNKQNNTKRTAIFIPFNENLIPQQVEKVIDVIYVGAPVSGEVKRMINDMMAFKYRCLSINKNKYATHIGADYTGKIKHISESKITVIHNLLWPRIQRKDSAKKYFPGVIQENKAFVKIANGDVAWEGGNKPIVPQLKGRTFESAFCRSLMLCRRDPWNLIENYFEPNKEFIYFEPGCLKEKLTEVLSNYDSYLPIVDAAFEKAINNYTSRHFFDKYLKDLFK
jgi:spore maturation protein CgeB